MILYFSSTGNCKYVAERLAAALHDRCSSVEGLDGKITLTDGEVFGIVSPTNWWGLAVLIREFIDKLELAAAGNNYTFLVTTYGTSPGFSASQAEKMLRARNVTLDAAFSVKMPDNWTPLFDVSDKEEIAAQNKKAEEYIEQLIGRVKAKEKGNHQDARKGYWLHYFADAYLHYERQTKFFRVEDQCIGCGLCAKKCPVQAIELKDKKPVWIKKHCALCLGCLHRCPKFAIQYGKNTKKHGQYKNPNTRV